MPNRTTVTLPGLTINGTSPKTLKEDYFKARRALIEATEALRAVEFHPRDYLAEGQWETARAERMASFDQLENIRENIDAILYHVCCHPKAND